MCLAFGFPLIAQICAEVFAIKTLKQVQGNGPVILNAQ